jgi:hypothetical protein
MRPNRLALPLAGMLVLLHTSCGEPTGPGDQTNGHISIVNNAAALAARVTYYDTTIPIDSTGVGYSAPAPAPAFASSSISRVSSAAAASFQLKLKAEVASPVIGSDTLQATSVSIVGNLAVVSYNMVGNPYLGAVDVIDISNQNKPVLVSFARLTNADVSAVSTSGQNVYVAEATADTAFQAPAVFEIMQLQGNQLVVTGNRRMGLTSFAGTSTAASGARAYATSGDAGALFVIDPATFSLIDSVNLHDARWVAVGGGKVVVVQGTPGQISVFNESNMSPVGTSPWPFTGADVAQSKSTAQVVGGKAFIAAGTGGVQVLSASTGTVVGAVARPNADSLGLPWSVVVTNAVAVDEDLLFISNGEAGVYLAQGSQFFSATGPDAPQTITMRGRLGFGNLQSVNHVAYQGRYLIIAAGRGGLKIVQVI